jgi:sarcosine oxidase
MSTSVIVLGLGGIGSAAACHLARSGQRVVGFDRYHPPHALGSSHGESRIIRQAYFEHPDYVPLLLRSYELWRELERQTGRELLHITGGLMIGPRESEVFSGSLRSAQEHGLKHDVLSAADLRQRFPQFSPAADELALYETEAGFVLPEAGVAAHLELAARAGTELHFDEPVSHWQAGDRGIAVTTARGEYHSDRLVIAPGAWAPSLARSLGLSEHSIWLSVTRNVMLWFEPLGPVEDFFAERFPIFMWQPAGELPLYGFPAQNGSREGVKVAIHGGGADCTPETIDRELHAADIDRVRHALAGRIPALNGKFLEGRTCMYTNSPDGHFLIGLHPRYENICYAVAFSGHGYKFAPVMGELLAELATRGRTRHAIKLFSPDRLAAAS